MESVIIKSGKHNDAIINLKKAIALNPKYAEAYYTKAGSYSKMSDVKSAISDLAKAFQLKPELKNNAKADKDFDDIRNNPDFKRLIGK